MKLLDFIEKYPQLKPIYEILKEYLMANPENIMVYPIEKMRDFGYEPKDNAYGSALPPDKLFFREIPPHPNTFAHELIHLCIKPPDIPEEVYGYNLAGVIVFMAENNIKNVNPFKLFHLTEKDIIDVLKKHGFNSIEDYYLVIGVLPPTHELHPTEKGLELKRDPRYTTRDIILMFLAEIIGGLPYFEICRTLLKELLEKSRDVFEL